MSNQGDNDFIRRLGEVKVKQAPPGLYEKFCRRVATNGSHKPPTESPAYYPDNHKTRLLKFAIAACACVVLGLGIWFYNSRSQKPAVNPPEVPAISTFDTERMFLFVEAREVDAKRLAFLQEMKGFEILKKGKGDQIQNYTILDILDDGIEVGSDDGSNEFLSRDDLQGRLDKALRVELRQLQQHLEDGNLSEAGLTRIGQWAGYGDNHALRMLESIAGNSSNQYQSQAQKLLYGGKQAQVVQKLLNGLASSNENAQRSAIRGLSKINSPHSLIALRKIAFGRQAGLQIAAVRGLGKLKDTASLRQLAEIIADQNTDPALQAVMSTVYENIIAETKGK
ncbi:HEAT repeat domain-containing protein [Planctomycetota bacterium]